MKKNLSFLGWALLMTIPFLFVACGDDDDDNTFPINDPKNIVEIAAGDTQFSTLVAALTQADLVSVLEGPGPFTVFAPTNAAFTAAGIDLNSISDEALKEVLLYHVLGGAKITSADIADGQTYASTASTYGPGDTQLSMLIEKGANGVVINGNTNVSTADVDATNGVIHIVDQVILPLDVVGHAAANSNFTTLVGALGAADAGLVDLLQTDGPFTVFAPLNSAFAAIQSTVDGLTTEQLAKVLTYHVVAGANVKSTDLSNGQEVTSANADEKFTINIDGSVTITDAAGGTSTVVLTDVQATNGIIHVLDSVIIPGNL
ncbi:fasciclin domain-containing protein [Saprospiraceae bacterium]|nr:fasciclin domain-containing protein [Saprospiraceae bacterium]